MSREHLEFSVMVAKELPNAEAMVAKAVLSCEESMDDP